MFDEGKEKLLVKILCINGVVFEKKIHSLLFEAKDGKMMINKNYSSVIEEVIKGKLKIYLNDKKETMEFTTSNGWLIVSQNVCEIFVSYADQI